MPTSRHSPAVSVVIPVYNEELMIRKCLQALLTQAQPQDEIIVVDNNSTDATAAILRGFDRQIVVIKEARSGVVFARTAGFDAAKNEIIARIDADTLVAPHWLAELRRIFAHRDIAATTGAIRYYDMPRIFSVIDRHLRAFSAVQKDNAIFLHGSNMAIRGSAWQAIRDDICLKRGVHEDLDVAVHLRQKGLRIFYAPRLVVSVSARILRNSWPAIRDYAMGNMRTYETHHLKRKKTTILVAGLLIGAYLPLRAIHRGYDPKTLRFSWRRMILSRPIPRKSPLS